MGKQFIKDKQAQSLTTYEAHYLAKHRRPQSEGLTLRAQSDPGHYSLNLAGNKMLINPKQRGDFTKGKICRWEDHDESSTMNNSNKSIVSASKAKQIGLGKEKASESKALKVYAKVRTRRIPSFDTRVKTKGVLTEEDNEEVDSGIDGDKPFLLKLDVSSSSSSSDSEEFSSYVSDTVEDRDGQLEGVAALLGDYEPPIDSNQKTSVQIINCEPIQSFPKIDELLPVWEGDGCKDGDQLLI